MGNAWGGGLLCIDETDATLHPAARCRSVDLLLKETGESCFQVAFATHSAAASEYSIDKMSPSTSDRPNDFEIAYLTDVNRRLEGKRNPAWRTITNDFFIMGPGSPPARVGVFSEDG